METGMANLSNRDLIEIKHFKIFLRLSKKYGLDTLLKRRFWRKYTGLDGQSVTRKSK